MLLIPGWNGQEKINSYLPGFEQGFWKDFYHKNVSTVRAIYQGFAARKWKCPPYPGYKWAAARQNLPNGLCAQRKISLGIRPVWSESLLLYEDLADAQADLSLCWAHIILLVCRAAAQMTGALDHCFALQLSTQVLIYGIKKRKVKWKALCKIWSFQTNNIDIIVNNWLINLLYLWKKKNMEMCILEETLFWINMVKQIW